MSNAFNSVTNLFMALREIERCLARADAATESHIKQEQLILAGTYGCRAFGALGSPNDELWTALKDYYKRPNVRNNLNEMLTDGIVSELAAQRVVELLVRLDYRPPEEAASIVMTAQQYTEDLNNLLFSNNGERVAGLDLVLAELIDSARESINHVAEVTCDLLEIAESRSLTEEDVQKFRFTLGRVGKLGIAIIAAAIQVDAVQAFIAMKMPSFTAGEAYSYGRVRVSSGPVSVATAYQASDPRGR